jgi:hypothetical protein
MTNWWPTGSSSAMLILLIAIVREKTSHS